MALTILLATYSGSNVGSSRGHLHTRHRLWYKWLFFTNW